MNLRSIDAVTSPVAAFPSPPTDPTIPVTSPFPHTMPFLTCATLLTTLHPSTSPIGEENVETISVAEAPATLAEAPATSPTSEQPTAPVHGDNAATLLPVNGKVPEWKWRPYNPAGDPDGLMSWIGSADTSPATHCHSQRAVQTLAPGFHKQARKPTQSQSVTIPMPLAAEIFYSTCGCFDNHNRNRQDTLNLEKKVQVRYWDKRVGLSLLGTIIVDTWLVYQAAMQTKKDAKGVL